MGKHKTTKARNQRQKLKRNYSRLREEAQVAGLIETTPEGAVRDERVDPAVQTDDPQAGLVNQAIRRGWAVPEERKPKLVDELVRIIEDPEAKNSDKVMAHNALTRGDQIQWERDNPELAGKTKGSTNVGVQINTGDLIGEALRRVEAQKQQVAKETSDAKEGRPDTGGEYGGAETAGGEVGSQVESGSAGG